MFSSLSPTYKGILLALTGYSAFAVADICAKWLMQYYTVSQVICIENILAVVLLVILSPLLGGMTGTFDRKNLKINLCRSALNFMLAMILNYSYKIFPIADVYTMIFTKPFMVTLLAFWFFREVASRNQWLAIVAGFIGVMIAMRPGTEGFDPMLFLPLLATVMIALLFFTARFLDKPSAFSAGFFPTLGVAVLAFPLMMTDFVMPELDHMAVFILLGIVAAAGMTAVSLSFRIAASSVVAPFLYIEMLWALVFGWMIFGDVPDLWMLAGAGIIILSGIYLLLSERRNLAQ
jgi:drug/metabolite transporter (DMT)-like permease